MRRLLRVLSSSFVRTFAFGALLIAACVDDRAEPESTGEVASALTRSFFVDPVSGVDVAAGGTQSAPWKTINFAVAQIVLQVPGTQPDVVLNLRAATYAPWSFPSTIKGTDGHPFTVQPWPGDPLPITFDGGIPALRTPNNGKWEPVPVSEGGVPGEYRTNFTIQTPDQQRYAWGQMMATKYRLINYAKIEDLRATNESFLRVPVSDPRPSLGSIFGDPAHKFPLAYLGPGIAFVFDDPQMTQGRIHIRLSPTHYLAPGIVDYAGETDPNKLALSIASKFTVPLVVASQHIVFKNVVAQNGGQETLVVQNAASDITFDHCQVYAGRIGVNVAMAGGGLIFRDCIFDGGLAPWTTRSDVKDNYQYVHDPDCPAATGGCPNDYGAKTSDELVVHHGDDALYERCTFRHGHDGIAIYGHRVEVRQSLFEDLNDEVLRFPSLAVDVKIHENVIRQGLELLSFHDHDATQPGSIFIYRNVFDQRVPTRGYRILPPDVDVPFIWRYGADIKNGPMPEFHVYQNTFISSSQTDKGSWVTLLFTSPATATRDYLNNIHLVLDLDESLSNLPAATTPAHAAGNVWFRYQNAMAPLYTSFSTFAALHAVRPDWEVGSLYQDPHLANFTDEYFLYGVALPNTDYRPIANVGGVALPAGLPDVAAYAGILGAGALPANAPPLAVGADAALVLPTPGVPIARASSDQVVQDVDGNGFATVALDGTASSDPEGGALTYAWLIDGKVVSTAAAPSLVLAEGKYVVRLVVTDPTGKSDSDAVVVTVVEPTPGENRLANPGFEVIDTSAWTLPSGSSITHVPSEVHSGTSSLKIVHSSTSSAGEVAFQSVHATPLSTYVVSGWVRTQGLTPVWETLSANVRDAAGHLLQSAVILKTRGNSPYAYAEQVIVTADTAASIEIVSTVDPGAGTGIVFLDDLRVRDRNLLANGGFEKRPVDANVTNVPNWTFDPANGALITSPGGARSGSSFMELAPPPSSPPTFYSQLRQTYNVPGPSVRLTAWYYTIGATRGPAITFQTFDAQGTPLGGREVDLPIQSGYTLADQIVSLPAATARVTMAIKHPAVIGPGTGVLHIDDVKVEPAP